MKSVLFVCMANTCRSPVLEALLRDLAQKKGVALFVDSCGLLPGQTGRPVDPKSVAALASRGIEINHRSQWLEDSFFATFDYLFGVTEEVVRELQRRAKSHGSKVYLATAFSEVYRGQEILDPYRLGSAGFQELVDKGIDCATGILNEICKSEL